MVSSSHHLVMFGGAGGQLGASIASALDISRIILPRFSSILSAYGMSLADVVSESQEPAAYKLGSDSVRDTIQARFTKLEHVGIANLQRQGFDLDSIRNERYLNCHYQGSATTLMLAQPDDLDFVSAFIQEHQRQFGFTLAARDVLCVDIRVRSVGVSRSAELVSPYEAMSNASLRDYTRYSLPTKKVYFEKLGYLDAQIVPISELATGDRVNGPAILFDETQTILVDPTFVATALDEHVVLDMREAKPPRPPLDLDRVDPIELSVAGHRFMSIAEQMGNILRQTAISTNIKERLDFSCALFSPDGGLVANAPHIPCHLGAMSHAVRYQANLFPNPGDLVEGDCLLSNHPAAGGSHLPDCTVIVPAFHEGKIVFWTAARAHHADIGGIAAGSMPPFSKEIWQEGAQIKSFKIVKKGVFDEEGVKHHFYDEPAKYPGSSGTRTLKDNISDLKAQVASW